MIKKEVGSEPKPVFQEPPLIPDAVGNDLFGMEVLSPLHESGRDWECRPRFFVHFLLNQCWGSIAHRTGYPKCVAVGGTIEKSYPWAYRGVNECIKVISRPSHQSEGRSHTPFVLQEKSKPVFSAIL